MARTIYIGCMPGAQGGQQRESDPLGLELQKVVSYDTHAETWVLLNRSALLTKLQIFMSQENTSSIYI